MNKEYLRRREIADKAASIFCKDLETNDYDDDQKSKFDNLYIDALMVAQPGSEEEKDYYFRITEFYLFSTIVEIKKGKLKEAIGDRKVLLESELVPIYNDFNCQLDSAIAENDRNKFAYIRKKAESIKDFNEFLVTRGYTIKREGCYIATAVYGSYECPQVMTLRCYRDRKLSNSFIGRIFIKFYYSISPQLVKLMGDKPWFINLCRKPLDAIVKNLQNNGFIK